MYAPLLVLFFGISFQTASAQCNPDDWVEWAYEQGRYWENYLLSEIHISPQEEVQIGDSLHLEMEQTNVILKNHPKQAYLNAIVRKLAAHTKRRQIPYKIHIIDNDKNLNALSIAGGHLYITTKMLDWMGSEDELAFVLAHEVAHVDEGHAVSKIKKIRAANLYVGPEYGTLAANIEMVATSPFGQIDEYQADRAGAILAAKAGYNPRMGLRFFVKLSKEESYDFVEKIMRTHPYSVERHNCLDDFMRNELGR